MTTAQILIQASDLEIGTPIIIGTKFAEYHGRPELAGQTLPVVDLVKYDDTPHLMGIQVEGFPMTAASTTSHLETVPTPVPVSESRTFESVAPEHGQDTYLECVLPAYIRTTAKHQSGRQVTCSVCRGKDRDDRPGYWFLSPQASVIANTYVLDRTPVLNMAPGDRLTIDGVTYELRDDKALHNPYLAVV